MASDLTTPARSTGRETGASYPRPSASASYCSRERKISESGADVPRPRTMMWSTHSRSALRISIRISMGLFNAPDAGSRTVVDCASLQSRAKHLGSRTRITASAVITKSQVDTSGVKPASGQMVGWVVLAVRWPEVRLIWKRPPTEAA
jgi:hypothetical protein